jgi:hypothetical protein
MKQSGGCRDREPVENGDSAAYEGIVAVGATKSGGGRTAATSGSVAALQCRGI